MNYKKILLMLPLFVLFFTSCRDTIMDWEKDPSEGEIDESQIPSELDEIIAQYDSLLAYTNVKLGVGVYADLYSNNETYHDLAVSNFNELTAGWIMKHAAMVSDNGVIDYNDVDALIDKANEDGMSVFGHTLVWYSNQNATYLNSLIEDATFSLPSGSNLIDVSGLADEPFTDWTKSNEGDGITIVSDSGITDTTSAIKLIASSSSSNAWDLQLVSPAISVDTSKSYTVSFFIRSDKAGQGRLSFAGLVNNYPYSDWLATGDDATEYFTSGTSWQKVQITVDNFTGTEDFKVSFDLGYLAGVTYYIDAEHIYVTPTDTSSSAVTNLITNGDFETGSLDPWSGWGNSSTRSISSDGEGYGDEGYAMVLTNPTSSSAIYDAQQVYTFSSVLTQGQDYTCSFMVKADTAATIQVQIQSEDYTAEYYSNLSVTTDWTEIEFTATPSTADRIKLVIDFASTATTFYFDDFKFISDGTSSSPGGSIVLEKTDDEKADIIGEALDSWIYNMVTRYKNDITAWDVVNEPMLESGNIRDGEDVEAGDDEFYWAKYLGKDYAVTAFKLAREYGNSDDILFVNDYNLEYNMSKLDGLISYVEYIESQGATVDGIGTQMHIDSDVDTSLILTMLEKLAATGKLIKISELDISLGTNNPSDSLLEMQSDLYQFVVESYLEYIPESQQYGIVFWGISDNAEEHENWLPDESPNLWDDNYERKRAYKGVADGFAGYDVSEDFDEE